jgi:hypothetical protein
MNSDKNEMHRMIPGFSAEKVLEQGASSPYAGLARSRARAGAVELADTWRGTAPFCDGQCLPGEQQIGTSNCGDGACCWTGHKVLCRNSQPTCQGTQTNTSCYGIFLVCDNGSYDYRGVWTSCSKYLCGLCFGFSW